MREYQIRPLPYDNDVEIAEEFMPDPFSEEPHSILHRKRSNPFNNKSNPAKYNDIE